MFVWVWLSFAGSDLNDLGQDLPEPHSEGISLLLQQAVPLLSTLQTLLYQLQGPVERERDEGIMGKREGEGGGGEREGRRRGEGRSEEGRGEGRRGDRGRQRKKRGRCCTISHTYNNSRCLAA